MKKEYARPADTMKIEKISTGMPAGKSLKNYVINIEEMMDTGIA